ncbi:ABC transporter permease [Paenibacillus polymyxa]|uniref:ABC transporter permease n=1 Tax=Paenibacillus polymyxa TaxID=1406 RepID=UPI003217D317
MILTIIAKVFLNQFRNPKWLSFVVIFPIFLILFIGYILQGAFGSKASLPNVDVVVLDNSTGIAQDVQEAITTSSASVVNEYGLVMNRILSEEEGKKEARLYKKVFVNMDGDKIKIYFNNADSVNGARVNGVFQGVADRIQTAEIIRDLNPELASSILSDNNANYELPMVRFDNKNFMTSYDYYGVAEITLMILYLAIIPLGEIFTDRSTMIRNRLRLAGVSDLKYYTASLIAYTLVAVIAFLPAFLVSIFALHVNWGQYPVLLYLYLMLFSIFVIILGMFLAVFIKQKGKINILMAVVIIPVFSFLGGSYSPFTFDLSSTLEKITLLSPLRWVNLGIFRLLYNSDGTMLIVSIGLLIICSFVMFALINWKSRREAFGV